MKQRDKPHELLIFDALLFRKPFTTLETRKHLSLQKGYAGEVKFDHYMNNLPGESLILKDLWLPHQSKFFQIDYGLIHHNTFFLFELKNYKGEYYYEHGKLFLSSGKEIDNPLLQLARVDSLLHQLLQELDLHVPIQSKVIFVNNEFTLLQAPRKSDIILSSQLKRYFQQFPTNISLNRHCYFLAKKLKQLALEGSPFQQLPDYSFEELKKGLRCQSCRKISITIEGKTSICLFCGAKEKAQYAILRNIEELRILFPQLKITTALMKKWLKVSSNRRIHSVLNNHFKKQGDKSGSYYI